MQIIKYPNEVLRQISEEVIEITDDMLGNINAMKDILLYGEKSSVGLAAPQVGILKRIIVVKDPKTNQVYTLINPEIVWKSFDKTYEKEGCLSIFDENEEQVFGTVERYSRIRVKYKNINNEEVEWLIKDRLLSRIVQHEIDHLNGILFIDYIKKDI